MSVLGTGWRATGRLPCVCKPSLLSRQQRVPQPTSSCRGVGKSPCCAWQVSVLNRCVCSRLKPETLVLSSPHVSARVWVVVPLHRHSSTRLRCVLSDGRHEAQLYDPGCHNLLCGAEGGREGCVCAAPTMSTYTRPLWDGGRDVSVRFPHIVCAPAGRCFCTVGDFTRPVWCWQPGKELEAG